MSKDDLHQRASEITLSVKGRKSDSYGLSDIFHFTVVILWWIWNHDRL